MAHNSQPFFFSAHGALILHIYGMSSTWMLAHTWLSAREANRASMGVRMKSQQENKRGRQYRVWGLYLDHHLGTNSLCTAVQILQGRRTIHAQPIDSRGSPRGRWTSSSAPSHSGGNHRRGLPNQTFLHGLYWHPASVTFLPPFLLLANCQDSLFPGRELWHLITNQHIFNSSSHLLPVVG